MHTERVTHRDPTLMTAGQRATVEARRNLPPRVSTREKHFNKGHLRNVLKYMPYIRRCRDKGRPPRGVPKKVLQTVVIFSLV